MSALDVSAFDELFGVVHGQEPFAWQRRLAAMALEGAWPAAIDVPTGLGKTAIIDIAVFNLAAQAERSAGERTAPMRTFVVVDRRVIVDQAYQRALRLQAALDPQRDDIAGEVARRLLRLCAGSSPAPLEVARMRGGTTWESAWLRSPAQPAVVCGTVDQIGSRLLFRGYGVRAHRRPIDAALVGTDRLLVLDEAHLSLPFVRTTESVDLEESGAERPILPGCRPRPILLSATPPLGGAAPSSVLRADLEAETSPVARARLEASRLVRLVTVKGKDQKAVADAMAQVAAARSAAGHQRVLVVANTVGLARRTFDVLAGGDHGADLALLIGRCRPIDRDRIAEEWLAEGARLSADRPRTAGDRPAIAVATQTVEVGADLDVDVLVTEACPLDSLLQRLGRLDRRGELGTSEAVVVHHSGLHDPEALVYGPAIGRTWDWLCFQAGTPEEVVPAAAASAADSAPTVDLGPTAVAGLLSPGERSALAAEPPLAPVALGVQLASWARTDPAPTPDQDVAPFLHGVDRRPQVQIAWRAWRDGDDEVRRADLEVAPLAAHECVEISLPAALRFLSGHEPGEMSDLEGDQEDPFDEFDERPALHYWLIDPDGQVQDSGRRLGAGWTVVLDVASGGHDEWGWTGAQAGEVADVADLSLSGRGISSLRLRPEVLKPLLRDAAESVCEVDDEADPDALLRRVRHAAEKALLLEADDSDRVRRHLLECLVHRCGVLDTRGLSFRSLLPSSTRIDPEVPERVALLAPRSRWEGVADAREEGTTSTASDPVPLGQHLRDVEERARRFAIVVGMDPALVEALALAGLAHDLGKADRRFQAMLHNGVAIRAEAWGEPLAKSGMDPNDRQAWRRARQRSGWPSGMRHEALSGALLDRILTDWEVPTSIDVELVGHLVVTHHGRGRPLLPPVTDAVPGEVRTSLPGGPEVAVRSDHLLVDWDGPSRFSRLGRRYGWWGLALLEAVVRLADQEVSAGYAQPSSSVSDDVGPIGDSEVREAGRTVHP